MHSVAEALFWGLLAHLVGDYLLQSDWMAARKTKEWSVAALHGLTYGIPFAVMLALWGPGGWRGTGSWAVIVGTHILIDHWRLARHVGWIKNQLAPKRWRHVWSNHVDGTGYHRPLVGFAHGVDDPAEWIDDDCERQTKPSWMSVWLMIITDNTMHVIINSIVLTWAMTR